VSLSTSTQNIEVSNPTIALTVLENDNPPVVSFSSASQNVSEGAGSASITVSLDHPSAFNISVDYALSGTATNGSDYSATSSGTLTFTAGQTSKTISATITDDSNLESTETIIATLSNLTGTASIGSTSTHTLSIIDNDQVNLSINDVTAAEGGTLTFTVSASMAPSANATFDWTREILESCGWMTKER
jgi:hypothetical protein